MSFIEADDLSSVYFFYKKKKKRPRHGSGWEAYARAMFFRGPSMLGHLG
jgi:hypothetical protein